MQGANFSVDVMNVLDKNPCIIHGYMPNKQDTYKGKTIFEVLNSITITKIKEDQYITTYSSKKIKTKK